MDLFEVKEHELDILEKGTPADLYLNYSIFLISIAVSTITTLFTAKFTYPIVQTVFVVVTVVGFLGSGFLFVLWRKTRTSVRKVINEIRCRIPPEKTLPAGEDAPSTAPSGSQN